MPPGNDTERTLGRLLQAMETTEKWQAATDTKLDDITRQLQSRHDCYQVDRIGSLERDFGAWKGRVKIFGGVLGFLGLVAGAIIKVFAAKGE